MQDTDIPVKILKENAAYIAEYIFLQYNEVTVLSIKVLLILLSSETWQLHLIRIKKSKG